MKMKVTKKMKDVGVKNLKLFHKYEAMYNSCTACALRRIEHNKIKVLLALLNEAFYKDIQAIHAAVYILRKKFGILNTVYMETEYERKTIDTITLM